MIKFFGRFFVSMVLFVAFAVPASALDRRVRIHNQTGFTMVSFYGSNKGTESWEEDILGSQVLPSGSSVVVNFDDGSGYCIFDFKAVFSDGDEVTAFGKNICELTDFYFN